VQGRARLGCLVHWVAAWAPAEQLAQWAVTGKDKHKAEKEPKE